MGIRRTPRVTFEHQTQSLAEYAQGAGLAHLESIDVAAVDVHFIRQLSLGLVREQLALPLWVKAEVARGLARRCILSGS